MVTSSTQRPVRVFISYAHGSAEHAEEVLRFWVFLRERGIDAKLDLPAAEIPQDWALWMIEQVRAADYVLVIASAAYRRRADGLASPEESRGVVFESGLLREEMYANPVAARRRILAVVLGDGRLEDIPSFLGQTSTTHYRIKALTDECAGPLLRLLSGQPLVPEPPLGRQPAGGPSPGEPQSAEPQSPAGQLSLAETSRGQPAGRPPVLSEALTVTAVRDAVAVGSPPDVGRRASAGAARQGSWSPPPRLSVRELGALVDRLLAIEELAGPPQWQRLLGLLPPDLAHAVPRHATGRMEAIALLSTCDRYPGGWPALVDALCLIAPASQAVDRLVEAISRLGLHGD